MKDSVIATNKKAYFNYFLSEKWECGIALTGAEIKSVRAGEVSFTDSFARLEKGEVYLYNLHINPYMQASHMNTNPDRERKLLLHRREIKKIDAYVSQKSFALIPTKLYFNQRGFAKVELAIGKGKKQYDKREDIKKRDIDRELRQSMKARRR